MAPGRHSAKPFSDGELRGLLHAIGYTLSAYRVRRWSFLQKISAWNWAVKQHLSQHYSGIRVPRLPPHVQQLPRLHNSEAS